jgi:hypothetical protein
VVVDNGAWSARPVVGSLTMLDAAKSAVSGVLWCEGRDPRALDSQIELWALERSAANPADQFCLICTHPPGSILACSEPSGDELPRLAEHALVAASSRFRCGPFATGAEFVKSLRDLASVEEGSHVSLRMRSAVRAALKVCGGDASDGGCGSGWKLWAEPAACVMVVTFAPCSFERPGMEGVKLAAVPDLDVPHTARAWLTRRGRISAWLRPSEQVDAKNQGDVAKAGGDEPWEYSSVERALAHGRRLLVPATTPSDTCSAMATILNWGSEGLPLSEREKDAAGEPNEGTMSLSRIRPTVRVAPLVFSIGTLHDDVASALQAWSTPDVRSWEEARPAAVSLLHELRAADSSLAPETSQWRSLMECARLAGLSAGPCRVVSLPSAGIHPSLALRAATEGFSQCMRSACSLAGASLVDFVAARIRFRFASPAELVGASSAASSVQVSSTQRKRHIPLGPVDHNLSDLGCGTGKPAFPPPPPSPLPIVLALPVPGDDQQTPVRFGSGMSRVIEWAAPSYPAVDLEAAKALGPVDPIVERSLRAAERAAASSQHDPRMTAEAAAAAASGLAASATIALLTASEQTLPLRSPRRFMYPRVPRDEALRGKGMRWALPEPFITGVAHPTSAWASRGAGPKIHFDCAGRLVYPGPSVEQWDWRAPLPPRPARPTIVVEPTRQAHDPSLAITVLHKLKFPVDVYDVQHSPLTDALYEAFEKRCQETTGVHRSVCWPLYVCQDSRPQPGTYHGLTSVDADGEPGGLSSWVESHHSSSPERPGLLPLPPRSLQWQDGVPVLGGERGVTLVGPVGFLSMSNDPSIEFLTDNVAPNGSKRHITVVAVLCPCDYPKLFQLLLDLLLIEQTDPSLLKRWETRTQTPPGGKHWRHLREAVPRVPGWQTRFREYCSNLPPEHVQSFRETMSLFGLGRIANSMVDTLPRPLPTPDMVAAVDFWRTASQAASQVLAATVKTRNQLERAWQQERDASMRHARALVALALERPSAAASDTHHPDDSEDDRSVMGDPVVDEWEARSVVSDVYSLHDGMPGFDSAPPVTPETHATDLTLSLVEEPLPLVGLAAERSARASSDHSPAHNRFLRSPRRPPLALNLGGMEDSRSARISRMIASLLRSQPAAVPRVPLPSLSARASTGDASHNLPSETMGLVDTSAMERSRELSLRSTGRVAGLRDPQGLTADEEAAASKSLEQSALANSESAASRRLRFRKEAMAFANARSPYSRVSSANARATSPRTVEVNSRAALNVEAGEALVVVLQDLSERSEPAESSPRDFDTYDFVEAARPPKRATAFDDSPPAKRLSRGAPELPSPSSFNALVASHGDVREALLWVARAARGAPTAVSVAPLVARACIQCSRAMGGRPGEAFLDLAMQAVALPDRLALPTREAALALVRKAASHNE